MEIKTTLVPNKTWTPPSDQAVILKIFDNEIWAKHGWGSGGEVDDEIFTQELKEKINESGMSYICALTLEVLEDENFHTLTGALSEIYNCGWNSEKGEWFGGNRKVE